jgi:membrane-bound lytic murein transglycosylase MltF
VTTSGRPISAPTARESSDTLRLTLTALRKRAIHAGVKYIRFMVDKYFANEPMDDTNKLLFAFAAYNAGPGRIHSLREEAPKKGLDPNVWVDNVEMIAAEKIGMETVTYVANIYKYYIAYKLVAQQEVERKKAKESVGNAR